MTLTMKVHRHKWLLVIAVGSLVFCVGALIWYVTTVPDPFYAEDEPVRTLKRNRERIDAYIENVYAGQIPKRADDQGYYVLDSLANHGARYVRVEQGCVVIYFACMPTDAVPTLIYSPQGQAGVPEEYKPAGQRNNCPPKWEVFDFTPIDAHWTYCHWDY